MSDTNRVGLYFAPSSARDVPVALSPNTLQKLRYTGTPGLGSQPQNVVSNEIRDDRQTTDLVLVGTEAGGNQNFELSALSFDRLIEGALFSTFTNTGKSEGTEVTAFGSGTFTADDADTIYEVGHLVRIVHTDVTGVVIDGVYEISTQGGSDVQTIVPITSGATNPAMTALTPNADTEVFICGVKAQSDGDISLTVSGGIATLSFPASLHANLMGEVGTGTSGDRTLVVGQWIKLSGFTGTTANNVWARITGVDAAADEVTFIAQSSMATDAAASDQVEIYFGDYIRNGTDAVTDHQFLVERRYTDHSPVTREVFLGMAVDQLQINLQPQSIATGQVAFFGLKSEVDTTVSNLYSSGTPTDVEAPDTSIYNTSTNVGRVAIGADNLLAAGVSADNLPLEVQITLQNNLRRRPAVGVFGAASVGVGRLSVGGNINTYFDSKAILDLILGNSDTQYNTTITASDGRTMVFDLPRIKFDGGAPDVPGGDQDAVLNPGIQALRDATLGYTIHVQRVHFAK